MAEGKGKYRDAIFRTIKRAGHNVVVPISSTYGMFRAAPGKIGSSLKYTGGRISDAIASGDPGEWGGNIAEVVARSIEGALKSNLDYQVEKAEDAIATYVHAREKRLKRVLTRKIASAQLLATGRMPDKINMDEPYRQKFTTKRGKEVYKLRQSYDMTRYMAHFQKLQHQYAQMGIPTGMNPMFDQMMIDDLRSKMFMDTRVAYMKDHPDAEKYRAAVKEKLRQDNIRRKAAESHG